MVIFSHIEHISHISNESQIFTQMATFSHIEHILHNHFATFHCGLGFFEILDFFMVVIAQVWSFVGQWYSWIDHRDGKRRNLIKLIKLFLINDILDFDNLSFSRYNHLKYFVCCVWNIEHLSDMFC
jgi:hypothetical protein